MSTDEQNLTLRRPSLAAPATSKLSITVLTTDAQLSAALKAAVAGRHPVFTVEDVEEAAAMATAGRCPILITDQALTEPALARITLPLRAHEPALVTIAVGNRGEDNALIGLLSAGAADRLMLKPVTSALARIVIDSAVREHRARKARAKSAPVPQNATAVRPPLEVGEGRSLPDSDESQSLPTEESRRPAKPMAPVEPELASVDTPSRIPRPSWIAVVAALGAVAFAVWWIMSRQLPDIDPRTVIAANLADARQAFDEGRYIDPSERSAFHYFSTVLALDPANVEARTGIDRIANRYVEDAEELLGSGRLAEAGLALERARHVRPQHPRLQALDALLQAEIAGILTQARESETREAQRLRESSVPSISKSPAPQQPALERVALAAKPNDAVAANAAATTAGNGQAPAATQLVALNQPDAALALIGEAQSALDTLTLGNIQPISEPRQPTPEAVPPMAAEPAPPKLITFVRPEYPNEALVHGFEGWVAVGLDVTAAGNVVNPRIEDSSSGGLFHRAALVAVRQWKYEPRPSEPTRHVEVRLEFKRAN